MPFERIPGQRLITQNLITSATVIDRYSARTGFFPKTAGTGRITWQHIQDLSALTDVFCLYDRAIIMQRAHPGTSSSAQTDLEHMLNETHFVDMAAPDSELRLAIAQTARRHLATYVKEADDERFTLLMDYALRGYIDESSEVPDDYLAAKTAQNWLASMASDTDLVKALVNDPSINRSMTFFLRSFVYLAYSDYTKVGFTPDTARSPIISDVLRTQERFRGRLLAQLGAAWKAYPTTSDPDMKARVSPFAAIALRRANGDKSRVTTEMLRLRQELAPLRKRLQQLEDSLLFGTRDQAIDAEARLQAAFAEIEANFGPYPKIVSMRRVLSLAQEAGPDIADNPTSWISWAGALLKLPLEGAYRLSSRRPFVEIHRLRPELPGVGSLRDSVEKLFGPIQDPI